MTVVNQDNFIIIIYFQNIHFFHTQLGSDVYPDMKPLHISLNTFHSECKPSSSISSFTQSLYVFLALSIPFSPTTQGHNQASKVGGPNRAKPQSKAKLEGSEGEVWGEGLVSPSPEFFWNFELQIIQSGV